MEDYKKINPDYNVPYYIFEEIVDYIEQTAHGKSKCMKWDNIKSLLRLAVINNSLTKEQADMIEKVYCREK